MEAIVYHVPLKDHCKIKGLWNGLLEEGHPLTCKTIEWKRFGWRSMIGWVTLTKITCLEFVTSINQSVDNANLHTVSIKSIYLWMQLAWLDDCKQSGSTQYEDSGSDHEIGVGSFISNHATHISMSVLIPAFVDGWNKIITRQRYTMGKGHGNQATCVTILVLRYIGQLCSHPYGSNSTLLINVHIYKIHQQPYDDNVNASNILEAQDTYPLTLSMRSNACCTNKSTDLIHPLLSSNIILCHTPSPLVCFLIEYSLENTGNTSSFSPLTESIPHCVSACLLH